MSATSIDSSWLNDSNNQTANGGYKLTTGNYQLSMDIYATGTFTTFPEVFQFIGNEIYLDLNGHYVYANNVYVEQTQLSQKASHNVGRTIAGNSVINAGGVLRLPNETYSNVNVDAARTHEYATSNPELF